MVGDSKQSLRTPVCTWNVSVNFPSCMTWQLELSYSCCMMEMNLGGLAHDVRTQIKICKIRIKICFRIAVIRRLFTCSSSNERHLVAIFM